MKSAVLALLMLSACATAPIPRIGGEPAPAVGNPADEAFYQNILEASTQSQAIYDNLDTKTFVRATVQSPRFVKARLAREAFFRGLPAAEVEQANAKEATRLSDITEFFVGVYTADYRWEDFHRADSMWRIALVTSDGEVAPLSIERLGRTTTEIRSYYSYMETFWVAYRLRFPKVGISTGTMRLKFSSSVGRAELQFPVE